MVQSQDKTYDKITASEFLVIIFFPIGSLSCLLCVQNNGLNAKANTWNGQVASMGRQRSSVLGLESWRRLCFGLPSSSPTTTTTTTDTKPVSLMQPERDQLHLCVIP